MRWHHGASDQDQIRTKISPPFRKVALEWKSGNKTPKLLPPQWTSHPFVFTPRIIYLPKRLTWVCLLSPWKHVCVLDVQLWLTLCKPKDCSPPGSSFHGILQATIPEWVAIPSSRGSSWSRDQTQVSYFAGRFSTLSHRGNPLESILSLNKSLLFFLDLSVSSLNSFCDETRTYFLVTHIHTHTHTHTHYSVNDFTPSSTRDTQLRSQQKEVQRTLVYKVGENSLQVQLAHRSKKNQSKYCSLCWLSKHSDCPHNWFPADERSE